MLNLIPEAFAGVFLISDGAPPPFIVEIPLNGSPYAGGEINLRPPSQLCLDFFGIDGVTEVVAGTIRDECYKVAVTFNRL